MPRLTVTRITIKTKAYAKNPHYLAITDKLGKNGYRYTPNVAIDGQVSIDTTAPADFCREAIKDMPDSVELR